MKIRKIIPVILGVFLLFGSAYADEYTGYYLKPYLGLGLGGENTYLGASK